MCSSPVRKVLIVGLAALLSAPAWASDYIQSAGSSLVFAGTYQGEVFTGRFPGFDTHLSFDPDHLDAASLRVTIPLSSATTANNDYDGEMRGASFFNAARFPTAQYEATGFRKVGDNRYATDGMLSLHGVNKPVTLQFTWTPGTHPVLTGKATVRRLAFGVGSGDWADTDLIPDDIAISTKVVLQPAQ
jgi:polyisoprenoid-binding protein YceI